MNKIPNMHLYTCVCYTLCAFVKRGISLANIEDNVSIGSFSYCHPTLYKYSKFEKYFYEHSSSAKGTNCR